MKNDLTIIHIQLNNFIHIEIKLKTRKLEAVLKKCFGHIINSIKRIFSKFVQI
jgi:predicted RNA-binding protein YlqC (UPF0109 family)